MRFPSAISRYLVSNGAEYYKKNDGHDHVSIRYIAVLGFQQEAIVGGLNHTVEVSIRYIAVLGFQHGDGGSPRCSDIVSIRYIAVLGFQRLYREG